jgi:nitrogen-specific signal transduction histidine kinase
MPNKTWKTVEGLLYFDSQGRIAFNDDYHNHAESKLVQERYLEVVSKDGSTVLYRNARLGEQYLGGGAVRIIGRAVGGEVLITISDRGEGIKEGNREKVFERFYREDVARSRQTGGVGLGLAIVKSTVEAHKGSVMLKPTNGPGFVFRVELPSKFL